MVFSWQVLIGISVVTYSLAVLLQRIILRTAIRPIAYSIFTQLVCAALLLVFGLVTHQLQFFDVRPVWVSLIIMAGLYAASNVCVAIALGTTEASKFTVLFATRGLITILITTLCLREQTGWWQLVGAGLIFLGVVCASWEGKRLILQKGDYYALAAAVLVGLGNANDRFALQHMPVYSYLVLAFLLPAVALALWQPRELKYLREFFRPPIFNKILLLNVFYALTSASFYAALFVTTNAAQVVAAGLTSVILIVGLSIIFLKERSYLWQKLVGAVLAFGGLLLLN